MTHTHDEVKSVERAKSGAEPTASSTAVPAADEVKDTRSPAEIEADLDRTRTRLSATLDELTEQLSPRELARRGGQQVKARFVDLETGKLRPAPVAAVVGGFGLTVGALFAVRKVRTRSS